jgi:hypothetical protein
LKVAGFDLRGAERFVAKANRLMMVKPTSKAGSGPIERHGQLQVSQIPHSNLLFLSIDSAHDFHFVILIACRRWR